MGNSAKKKRRRSISNDAAAKVGFDGGSAFSCMAFVIMGLGVKFSMAFMIFQGFSIYIYLFFFFLGGSISTIW